MVDAQPTRNKDLNATLTNFWEINKIPDECNDPEATDVQKHFQDTIEFNKVTGRYNVRLPWKDNKQNLPTNFTLTKKRLNNLQHTLKGKHPERIYKYNDQLLDQLKRGFIEQVLDPNTHQGVIHYIPHFPVFKESSTTAMRIVYDASAKISSTALSLNDCLHTGHNHIQRLQSMLLTFRSHKIAFTADIEKAFLQMELNTQDREYLTGLREHHSSQKNKNISGERVARGKVVLIHHETPRNQWKLGVIIQLHQEMDGLVRSVTLRTAKGNLISRPVEKLYHLEVLAEEDNLHYVRH